MADGPAGALGVLRRALGFVAVLAWGLVLILYGATIVRGGSMEPTLVSGDIVVYRRGSTGLERGSVVLFAHEGWAGGVLHRVATQTPDGALTTSGDANDTPDRDPLRRGDVRGVAVAVIPTGRMGRAVAEALR
ncbi:MAG: signal peptidase I [Coriobacteriia bacterium]